MQLICSACRCWQSEEGLPLVWGRNNPPPKVLVRTYSAGVHVGELESKHGTEVVLRNSRQIWRWRGANTLREIAVHGIDSAAKSGYSRVSEPAPRVVLTQAVEILDLSEAAWESVCSAGWAT